MYVHVLNMLTSKFCIFQAELSDWHSHEHNMGLAFDRATWNKIKKCSEVQTETELFYTCAVCINSLDISSSRNVFNSKMFL